MKRCFYCDVELQEGEIYVDPFDNKECCLDCLEEGREAAAMGADGDDLLDTDFADLGGRSALRAATLENPRIHPCPACGAKNVLTARDVSLGYQCDSCADRQERGAP